MEGLPLQGSVSLQVVQMYTAQVGCTWMRQDSCIHDWQVEGQMGL